MSADAVERLCGGKREFAVLTPELTERKLGCIRMLRANLAVWDSSNSLYPSKRQLCATAAVTVLAQHSW